MPADAEDRIIPPSSQDSRERPDFEPVQIKRRRSGLGLKLFLGLLVIAGAAGAWYVLDSRQAGPSGGRTPIIRAEIAPVKERPEQPGGMDIPNRDKQIYDRVDGGGDSPAVERLLPEAEQPAPAPGADTVSGEQEDTSLPDVPSVETVESLAPPQSPEPPSVPKAPAPKPSPAPAKDEAAPEQPMSVQQAAKKPKAPEPAHKAPKAPEPTAAETAAKAAKAAKAAAEAAAAPAPAADGKEPFHRVQVASVRSAKGAETAFKQMRKKHGDLFAAKALYVQRVDLGAPKGVYFRVRVGPYNSAGAAKQACSVLKKRDGGCLVVPPGR